MKKSFPYTLVFVLLLIAVGGVLLIWRVTKKERHFDPTISLYYKDKRPYGAYVAYQELPRFFPGSSITVSKRSSAFLRDLDDSDRHQLMFVLSPQFYANSDEWTSLLKWVKQGNYLFVSANRFTQDVKGALRIQLSNFVDDLYTLENPPPGTDDSLQINLLHHLYGDSSAYFYPGRKFDRAITSLDSSITDVLGTNDLHYANLIRFQTGDGVILIQTAPMAFSNYFMLYGNNIRYFEDVLSTLPAPVHKVIWNEYYLYRQQDTGKGASALGKLLKDPALGPAFLLLLLILAVYVLLGVKRRQRVIPEIAPKSNESLDFVKTIGRLYYEKRDHKNLAIKMGQHFQEYIRSRYQGQLDLDAPASIRRVSQRAAVDEDLVKRIATHIRYAQDAPDLQEDQLDEFYQLLENFYKIAQ